MKQEIRRELAEAQVRLEAFQEENDQLKSTVAEAQEELTKLRGAARTPGPPPPVPTFQPDAEARALSLQAKCGVLMQNNARLTEEAKRGQFLRDELERVLQELTHAMKNDLAEATREALLRNTIHRLEYSTGKRKRGAQQLEEGEVLPSALEQQQQPPN